MSQLISKTPWEGRVKQYKVNEIWLHSQPPDPRHVLFVYEREPPKNVKILRAKQNSDVHFKVTHTETRRYLKLVYFHLLLIYAHHTLQVPAFINQEVQSPS